MIGNGRSCLVGLFDPTDDEIQASVENSKLAPCVVPKGVYRWKRTAPRTGRLEPIAGDVLRELARHELLGLKLFVIGSTVEASARVLLPRSIIAEGYLDLLSSAESRQKAMEELLPVIQRADKSFRLHPAPDRCGTTAATRSTYTRRSLLKSIDQLGGASEEHLSVLYSLLDLEPVSAVAIAP